jgi:56kDa selenium binding protein (SBP56)
MTMRPDPTFHASAKLAMQAPPEKLAYTVMLSPDFSRPDALAVVDVDPGSTHSGRPESTFSGHSGPRGFVTLPCGERGTSAPVVRRLAACSRRVVGS